MSIYAAAIPKWGIEMEKGTVTEWHSEIGDRVTKGDELVDLESDKIINTLEATGDGILRRQFAETGDELVVGQLIGIIADASESDEDIDAFVAKFNAALGTAEDADSADSVPTDIASDVPANPEPATAASTEGAAPGRVRVSPPVRRLAEKLGVDLDSVVGSGPNGRITTEDVEKASQGAPASAVSQPLADGAYSATKLSATQQTIGRRLVESKQSIPHFYLSTDIRLDALLAKRQQINSSQAVKVSINSMIVYCVAKALKAVPGVNAQLIGDELRQFEQADISVAVATDRGLLTPVLKAADSMDPVQIATGINELVEKAKQGKLQRDEIEGGSFTVSNLGMYGVKTFDAIINPPQVAILALGQAQKQMVVREDNQAEVATVVSASLSSDHRVVDGALGGSFLSALKNEIETID